MSFPNIKTKLKIDANIREQKYTLAKKKRKRESLTLHEKDKGFSSSRTVWLDGKCMMEMKMSVRG